MDYRNLLALCGALALSALALPACQRQAQDASTIPHTPIPKTQARLSMAVEGGRIRYEGVVADPATRDAVAAALESAAAGASGTLAIEPQTTPAAWVSELGAAAAALRPTAGRLTFAGRRIELAGDLTQEQRATLHRRIGRLYPGYELTGAFRGADPRHALPDEGDEAGLLRFLNARPIEFQPGTGMLTSASVEALARAARGLRAGGSSTRVALRVHPEPDGDADQQQAIARQRADAVLTQLALRGVAPGRIQAVIAPAAAAKADRVVEFAPFQPEVPGADGTAADRTPGAGEKTPAAVRAAQPSTEHPGREPGRAD